MKRSCTSYCLLLLTLSLIAFSGDLKSQSLPENTAVERIRAFTDRNMYIAGENILFSAFVYNMQSSFAGELSRVLYCELITPDGRKITGRKYLLHKSSGQGCITIPDETISGVYYLKFYTRIMRNLSTDEYEYIMLKIVNPYKTEVLPGHNFPDSAKYKQVASAEGLSMNIASDKNIFLPREEVRLSILANPGKGLKDRLCLSVIPENTYTPSFIPNRIKADTGNKEQYFAETRGISLSGQVVVRETGRPAPDARVNLSIIGDRDIMVLSTDSSGRFYLDLPYYYGNRDIFLCAGEVPGGNAEILIDNDFCSRPVNLPSPLFTLNEGEIKAAYKLAVNSRVSSVFRMNISDSARPGEPNKVSFYGKPSEVLTLDKYIDLQTLEEYFTQLPGSVTVVTSHGRHKFRFFTTQEEMSANDPLLLVDWVAVNDIEKILAMSPRAIERVELVNSPYIKGNITYGGIISFVSKKNDFAGIDLPKSGTFVNYSFLGNCNERISLGPIPRNIPDSRNTVYWNPAVVTSGDGAAAVSFPAPGTSGKYRILLRGIRGNGEVVLKEEMIEVRAGNPF